MKNKVISVVLIICLAFLAGYTGAMLAVNQSRISIKDAEGNDVVIPGGEQTSVTQPGVKPNQNIIIPDVETIAEAIAEKTMASVVGISTVYEQNVGYGGFDFGSFFGGYGGFGGFGQGGSRDVTSMGTGVIVDAAGYILTNSHVVNDGTAKSIKVSLYDGRVVDGSVLWNDATLDLAVVKVDVDGLSAAELGDSDLLKIGSYAAVIGNPLSLEFERSMSQGIISGLNRSITVASSDSSSTTKMEGLIQTDATINSGNSGGPLLNSKGQVVGINSAKAQSGEGMGFAIPINIAKPIVDQIKATGTFTRAYLGINGVGLETQSGYTDSRLNEMFGTSKGIYIAGVSEGGGAQEAGLEKGDVITALDGTKVGTMNKINQLLITHKPGDVVNVEYMRDGKVHSVDVTLK